MPHLQFQSLGDGNCLYNTQAVWLIYAYQQQALTALFENEQTRNNYAKLFIRLGEQNPSFGLPKTLAELNTVQALQTAFDTFIAHTTAQNGLDIDWIKVQKTFATALRAFVVDRIKTDPTTNAAIKENLATYIDNIAQTTYEMSTLQEGIRAVRLEFTIHFDSQSYRAPAPRRNLRSIESMKQSIENELVEFIDAKMSESTEKREQITNNVKDELKRLVRETLGHSKRRVVHTLRDEVLLALRNHLQAVIKNDMAEDTMTLSAHFQNMPEIEKEIKAVIRSTLPTVEQQKQVLKNWFFENDAKGFNLYLSDQGGIATNGINAGELEQKVLSHAFNHVITIKSLRYPHNLPRVVNGLISSDDNDNENARIYPENAIVFDMEWLSNHWNALLPDNENARKIIDVYAPQRAEYVQKITQEMAREELTLKIMQYGSCDNHRTKELPELSIAEYCSLYNITQTEYLSLASHAQPVNAGQARRNAVEQVLHPIAPRAAQAEEQDWVGYSLMFIALTAILATISHGIAWPLLAPFAEAILPNSALFLAQISSCALFSTVFGFILTEKIYSEGDLETSNIDPVINSTIAAAPTASASSWWPASFVPSFLFHQQQAQPQQATTPTPLAIPANTGPQAPQPQPLQATTPVPKQHPSKI